MVQFRKSKKAGPFRFTLSRRGVSYSVGGGPFRVSVGADRKVRRTIRVPRTGVYDTKVIGATHRQGRRTGHPMFALLVALLLIGVVVAFWKVVLTIAFVIAIAWVGYARVRRNRAFKAAPVHQAPAGEATGLHGEYPPTQSLGGAGLRSPMPAEGVSRVGKPRLWRDHPGRDEIMIQVDIWPTVPDPRWWGCFQQVVAERHIKVRLDSTARGGIATRADNTGEVPAAVAAIDSAIDSANHLFVRTIAPDEVEKFVNNHRTAGLAEAQTELDLLAADIADPPMTNVDAKPGGET